MQNISSSSFSFIRNRNFWINTGLFSFCATLFLMPFPRSWSLYALGASLVSGLVLWIISFKSLGELFIKKIFLSLPLIIYFFLYLIWFFFCPEWNLLEGSLMFLLVPIFGFPVFVSDVFAKKSIYYLRYYVFGILLICIFELTRAILNSVSFSEGHISFNTLVDFSISATSEDYFSAQSRFRSAQLSFLEHPIYLSLKVIFAITLIMEFRKNFKISKPVQVLSVSLLIAFVYLLSSRIGYIILIFILVYFSGQILKRFKLSWILIPGIPILIFSVYKISVLNPRIHEKTDLLIKNYKNGGNNLKDIDPRFVSWFTASELIAEHPVLGVGLDARDMLAAEYEKSNYHNEALLRLNAHNQFLETQLTFGIPGTIILLWMLLTPLIKRKDLWNPPLVIPFLIIVTVSMIFESILVRQWGIMFFVLFYCFLTIPDRNPG